MTTTDVTGSARRDEAAEDLVRAFTARAQEQAARAARLTARMRDQTVTEASPDGAVRVTVDARGGLAGLEFGDAARRLPLDELARLTVAAARAGQTRLAGAVSRLVAEVYGPESATTGFVHDVYARQFPVTAGEAGP